LSKNQKGQFTLHNFCLLNINFILAKTRKADLHYTTFV
jgi:hypothetical protein